MGILISQGKKATDTMKTHRALGNKKLIVLSFQARALGEGLWKRPQAEIFGIFFPLRTVGKQLVVFKEE